MKPISFFRGIACPPVGVVSHRTICNEPDLSLGGLHGDAAAVLARWNTVPTGRTSRRNAGTAHDAPEGRAVMGNA